MIVSRTGSSEAAGSEEKIERVIDRFADNKTNINISDVSLSVNVVNSTLTYIMYYMFLTNYPTLRGH